MSGFNLQLSTVAASTGKLININVKMSCVSFFFFFQSKVAVKHMATRTLMVVLKRLWCCYIGKKIYIYINQFLRNHIRPLHNFSPQAPGQRTAIELQDQNREVHQENECRPRGPQCPRLHCEANRTFEVCSLTPC